MAATETTPLDVVREALRPGLTGGILENRARRVVQSLEANGFVIDRFKAAHQDVVERMELLACLQGMLAEWDKFARYGSPIAKAANERVNAARAAVARAEARG